MTPVRVAPLVLLPLWYSALAGQNGAARPAVAVINLRFNGEHANVLQPGDTAVVAAATSKLRATLGASDVGTIVGSGATATAVAQAEADGNPCDNACALAVAPRIGARWVAKGTISNLSNIGRLLFVALLTGPRAVSERGAAVTVIDVDSLRREFPVRSLSELLTGRVPGLVVLASSGTIGTASRLVIRGASSVRGSEAPQVYVDGIRVDDEPSTLTVSVGGQTTSRVDDVNVEDIATIAILRGPAAAALYGRDATAGVLLVTTKREQGGRPRLTAFTSQGLVTRAGRFPDNFLALDSTGRQCDAGQLVTSTCRLLRANVLESPATSPFRDGYLRQYGLRVSGGGATTRYYLAGQWDGLAGVYALPGGERARLLAAGGLRPETESPHHLGPGNLRGHRQLLAGPNGGVTPA